MRLIREYQGHNSRYLREGGDLRLLQGAGVAQGSQHQEANAQNTLEDHGRPAFDRVRAAGAERERTMIYKPVHNPTFHFMFHAFSQRILH